MVDQRSTYRSDPWGRAERSFASVQTWIYGGPTAIDEGHRLRTMCRILQVPERMLPPTTAAYWAYYEDTIDRVLENHPTAHSVIAVAAKTPPLPSLPAPLRRLWPLVGMPFGEFNRMSIVGTLPPSARAKLGLTWSATDERLLRSAGVIAGRLNRALPERVAYMPIAREARRAARGAPRGAERLARTLAERPL